MQWCINKLRVLPLLFFVVSISTPGLADQGKGVVFYPTDVSEAGNLSYLQDSVRIMLAGRLAILAGIQPHFESDGQVIEPGRYHVRTSLVNNLDGITIFAFVQQPGEESPVATRSAVTGPEQIMAALNDLAGQVGVSFFGVEPLPVHPVRDKQNVVLNDFSTPHPDRYIKKSSGFSLSIAQNELIAEKIVKAETVERYKGTVLPFTTRAMTAGDIDGDSLDEILLAENTKIHIYQLREKRFHPLTSISLPGMLQVHALNVADLNDNGLMEIYLSATTEGEPRSFVLEWHPKTGVEWLHEEIPLFLRPMTIPGTGTVLAAQRGGVSGGTMPGIYQLSLQAELTSSAGKLLPVPDSVNLFEFVFADLEGDGEAEVVSLNNKEELKVFDSDFQLLYTSPSGFGGREIPTSLTRPIRIVVADFNGDHNDDILLADNELSSPTFLTKSKYYKNGQVRGLFWDRDLFLEMWHTNIFQKAIVDLQFLPVPNADESDARRVGRLFVVEPEKGNSIEGYLFGSGATRLSVYEMKFIPQAR